MILFQCLKSINRSLKRTENIKKEEFSGMFHKNLALLEVLKSKINRTRVFRESIYKVVPNLFRPTFFLILNEVVKFL